MPKSRGRLFCLIGVGAILLVATGLGVGLGVGLTRNKASQQQQAADTSNGKTQATGGTSTSSNTSTVSITPKPQWNWLSNSNKMYGVSLGNWLALERWMDEDWFTSIAGPDAWDEWDLTQTLGKENATTFLENHYSSFITADNISTIASYGFNHIRVPISFWAFIPTTSDEPYVGSIQLPHLDRIAAAAYENDLYIVLNIHGLPGSQNGLQQSGHNTSDIQFWNPDQQTRGDATIAAAIAYVENSPYRSIFSAIAVANEPVTYSDGQLDILASYYERSYKQFESMSEPKVPMIFHDAYQGRDYWLSYVNGKNSSLLLMQDHPYPGNFPIQTGESQIMTQICEKASGYGAYPIPVLVTEFSLTTGITNNDWYERFYAAQVNGFSMSSAGVLFWSWQTKTARQPVIALNASLAETYSFVDLANAGIIPRPSQGQNTTQFMASLTSPCQATPPRIQAGLVQATPTGTRSAPVTQQR